MDGLIDTFVKTIVLLETLEGFRTQEFEIVGEITMPEDMPPRYFTVKISEEKPGEAYSPARNIFG
jgi:hypothetical protein